ncbi:SsgA family sporulation/cell division regulator [Streptomyces sp. 900116325]
MTQPFPSAAETTVTRELVVHVVVGDEPQVPLPAGFHYHRSDPYAIRLSIGSASAGTVDWVFALSLLEEGMSQPAGIGDVLISPHFSPYRSVVRIVIRSRVGSAVLHVAASTVADFLDHAHRLVPSGSEGRYVDIDRAVALLLNDGE